MTTQINWFEIPITNLARAAKFYETVLDGKLRIATDSDASPMAIFNNAAEESCGCLTETQAFKASADGVLVYLDASPSIQKAIEHIVPAGGKVVLDKFELPRQLDYIAHLIDTEGNRIALHAMQ
ncbi:VOC family protein [Herbaspirillum sp. RV1423]|uniref:VOC family protein n=1 Tax=Herbaspirillum sp. RV1423 TaxID=1443993 RepID=UPI0004AF0B40|nr:VOC family protein [Herbaspirillum sp. RV1423]